MNVTGTGSSALPKPIFSGTVPRIRLRDILSALIKDLGLDSTLCQYLLRRTRNEGIKFLTQALPELSSMILASLERGGFKYLLAHPARCSFKIAGRSPLRVLILGLYDRSGKPQTSALAKYSLHCILQICEYFKKLELPSETEINLKGAVGFLKKNREMGQIPPLSLTEKLLARHIWDRVFPVQGNDEYKYYREHRVGDGPGTFSRELPQWKDGNKVPCAALKRGSKHNVFDVRHKRFKKFLLSAYPEGVRFKHHSREYSELLLVPKNTKSVRAIVREPMANLRLQRPYFLWKVDHLKRVTNGRYNVLSQDINRERCRTGSKTRKLSTLDFGQASNSVCDRDVRDIRINDPAFTNLYDGCRTKEVFVPDNFYDIDDRRNGMHISNTYEPSLVRPGPKGFTYDGNTLGEEFKFLIAQAMYLKFIPQPDFESGKQTFNGIPSSLVRRSLRIRALVEELRFLKGRSILSEGRKVVYNNRVGSVHTLHMLAGMGSYLTFCTMMEWFTVLYIMAAVRQRFGDFSVITVKRLRTLLNEFIDELAANVSMYGDDFIAPDDYIDSFISYAASRGAVINESKSFRHSRFRESCGPYYYDGTEVTPIRLSLEAIVSGDSLTTTPENMDTFSVKLSAHSEHAANNGFPSLAKLFRKNLRRGLNGTLSGAVDTSGGFGAKLRFEPKRVEYDSLPDTDKYRIWLASEGKRDLTAYGELLYQELRNRTGTSFDDFMRQNISNPLVFQYQPIANPAIPKSGSLTYHKGDVYSVLRYPRSEALAQLDSFGLVHLLAPLAMVLPDVEVVNEHS